MLSCRLYFDAAAAAAPSFYAALPLLLTLCYVYSLPTAFAHAACYAADAAFSLLCRFLLDTRHAALMRHALIFIGAAMPR